jgi:uncharacterized membrane protein YdjX (TVP38/TMEM64 family)
MRNGRQGRLDFRFTGIVIGAVLIVAAWLLLAGQITLEEFAGWLEPHRDAWYALPGVALAYIALGLMMVPVLLLIAATGVAFGPWLGPVYAMAGSLASASIGFAIGRWAGGARVEAFGGDRVARITRALEHNGTLAVFLMRKVPAPFLLSNIVAGAARIRYRDFVVGTILGMAAIVVALAGFGYHLSKFVDDPTPSTIAAAALAVLIPLALAWAINRAVRRARHGR